MPSLFLFLKSIMGIGSYFIESMLRRISSVMENDSKIFSLRVENVMDDQS